MSDNKYSKNISISNIVFKFIKVTILTLVIIFVLGGMIVGGMVASVLEESPDVDPTTMISSLTQTSTIYDSQGALLEKVQNPEYEYRTVVTLDRIPQHLIDAFVSIEDERFLTHPGVDIVGIGASILQSARSGGEMRGASTITQQLVRNMYLTNDRSLVRKLNEAYLSLQVEETLNKNQILEAYLNKIYLGQGAYGVQEAAQTYFNKNVEDLTIAESAVFAGIVKSTTANQPFLRIEPRNFDETEMDQVGTINVNGQTMFLIYNPKSIERQKLVLSQMRKLGKITEEEYQEALNQDIKASLDPGEKIYHSMTSYPVDYIQTQATELLAKHYDISYTDAQKKLFNEGLKIYSTVDQNLQGHLEDMYNNFTEIIAGDPSRIGAPFLIDWSRDSDLNIIDSRGNVLYYNANNIVDENHNIIIPSSSYEYVNGDLIINNRTINASGDYLNFSDVYTINAENNLVTHDIGPLLVPSNQYTVGSDGGIRISAAFLEEHPDLFTVVGDNNALRISQDYYEFQREGIVQPQSATVIMDYKTGQVKALVGGRDVEGNRILNRAVESRRQPGSAIKPISVYYPSLAEGFTAGSIADDVPITVGNNPWPRNDYSGYRGLLTYRMSLDISSNAGTVDALNKLGIDKSLEYLEKMNIISSDDPENDSIITAKENPRVNDENPSALALGGMTNGLTPIELTAAYGTIANDGTFIEPKIVTKILDNNGNVIVDDTTTKKVEVTDNKTAYIMKNMLKTVVDNGYTAKSAKLDNMATAGKTGTTNDEADIWFVGFTPYYVIGTWIGNDTPSLVLNNGSIVASQFWNEVAETVHQDLEPIAEFEEPEGIVSEYISYKSGKLSTRSVSSAGHSTSEIFVDGTQPTEYDDSYKSFSVCTVSGRLSTKWCPSTSSRYAFVRDEPYDPDDHGGVVPDDVNYVPTSYCNVHTQSSYNNWYYGPYGPGYSYSSGSSSDDDSSSSNESDDSDDD